MSPTEHVFRVILTSVLIADVLSLELEAKAPNLFDEGKQEVKACVAATSDQLIFPETGKDELSEAILSGPKEVIDETAWTASESQPMIKNKPLSKRRVEIHPKLEGRVTLTQIEKECEESMRKQLKENQHKKKLQFNFIGKRNDTGESSSIESALEIIKRNVETETDKHPSRSSGINGLVNVSNLKDSGKRWMTAREMQPDEGAAPNINKLPTEKNIQTANKILENSAVVMSNPDSQKNQDPRNDNIVKTLDSSNTQTIESGDLNQVEHHDNKMLMREITDGEDRDLKLLKLLYEGLNSKDVGINEVEPLVKTLKDIAEKKMAMNMITHNNITTKSVAMKTDDKLKNTNQMKCASELLTKLKEYKDKQPEKKIIYSVGSSPLNPCLLNSKKDTLSPVMGKNVFLSQPKRMHPELLSFPRKNTLLSSSLEQTDSPELQLFPHIASNSSTENKSMGDYAVFVQLIDRILGTINDNNTETTEIIHDLNRKLLGTNKEVGSYRMLEDLVREFGNSVAKIKESCRAPEKTEEEKIEELMRNSRDVKNFNRYIESRARNNNQAQNPAKPSASGTQSSAPKSPSKNWSKSDELKRLQKVATELKSKIDDLLTNLEGTMSDSDDDDDDDEDDDDDDDDGDDDSLTGSSSPLSLNTGMQKSKASSDDPFESFKKFKTSEPKNDNKRKFKEYEPRCKDRLSKIVGKKPITMSTRLRALQERNKDAKFKSFKSKRDKRDDITSQYYDKYDIYNFKSSRRKSADDISRQGNEPPDNSYAVDPARLSAIPNGEYPITYKNSDNNFNVFRVANEFKKVHRDMIDKRMESSLPRVSGFQKYLGNNQIKRGKLFDIRKQYDKTSLKCRNSKIAMKSDETRDDFDDEPIANNIKNTKRNDTDVPHWLDYNDSDRLNNLIANPKKKYTNKYKKDKGSLIRGKRSLKNIFGYFKGNKTKTDGKLSNKIALQEAKAPDSNMNSEQFQPASLDSKTLVGNDVQTALETETENLSNQLKPEQVTLMSSGEAQFSYLLKK